jgi:hypothetical protein
MASNNSNYNKISVKTDSMVKMIEQLAKLGVFKEKRKPRAKRATGDIRQTGDMGPGYVTTLKGEPGRGDPNLFALRQIQPGMSQQEIADIQERNNAGIAALREEVQQQRLADVREQGRIIGGLSEAAAGEFQQLRSGLADIRSGKFGASSGPRQQSSVILLSDVPGGGEPDIQEGGESFTQTLNEGGPKEAPIATQTELFAETGEEEEGIPTSGGGKPFQPVQGIFKEPSKFATPAIKKRAERGISLGLGPPPQARNTSEEKTAYYFRLAAIEDFEPASIRNAKGYLDAINAYLDDDRNFLST